MKILYRYIDVLYTENKVGIRLETYTVTKSTRCGVQIDYFGKNKFVNLTANKKFACENIEDAKQSFIARKKRQIRILKSNLYRAEKALDAINNPEKISYLDEF